jgi:hypothetical protein
VRPQGDHAGERRGRHKGKGGEWEGGEGGVGSHIDSVLAALQGVVAVIAGIDPCFAREADFHVPFTLECDFRVV